MPGETPDIYEEDLMAAQVAKLDFALAKDLHARALAAEETDEVCALVRAYTRVTRSMRQNLILLTRQKTERARAEREARADRDEAAQARDAAAREARDLARRERLGELHDAIGRIANTATGGDLERYGRYVHRLDLELEDWREEPDFLDFELDVVVRHAARVLELPVDLAYRWRELPKPSHFADPILVDEAVEPRGPYINWPPGSFARDGEPLDEAEAEDACADVAISDSA